MGEVQNEKTKMMIHTTSRNTLVAWNSSKFKSKSTQKL